MPYKITIERIETVKTSQKGQWQIIAKRPWTEAEISNRAECYDRNHETSFVEKHPLNEVFDYAPDREVLQTATTEIFKQIIPDIYFEFEKVVKAVNNIK